MTIELYPQDTYYVMIKNPTTQLGSYSIATDGDLSLAHIRAYHRNIGDFSYNMRLVCSSKVGGPALAASNWEIFSNETIGQTTEFWIGDLTFTFDDYRLRSGSSYYFRFEIQNYIRQSNDIYLGIWLDWMQPIGVTNSGGARIALGVKR